MTPWTYLTASLVLVTTGFFAGFSLEHKLSENKIQAMQLAQDKQLAEATQARDTANAHAVEIEHRAAQTQADLASRYERKMQDEKAANTVVVNNLRTGITSLRVSLARIASSGDVSSTTTSPGGGDGSQNATLAPTVAARLADRYAGYNALVNQLTLCQDIVTQDRQAGK